MIYCASRWHIPFKPFFCKFMPQRCIPLKRVNFKNNKVMPQKCTILNAVYFSSIYRSQPIRVWKHIMWKWYTSNGYMSSLNRHGKIQQQQKWLSVSRCLVELLTSGEPSRLSVCRYIIVKLIFVKASPSITALLRLRMRHMFINIKRGSKSLPVISLSTSIPNFLVLLLINAGKNIMMCECEYNLKYFE